MVRAVIFDVDGVIVDSVDLHARSWQETFRRFGHEISLDELRRKIGKGGDQLMPEYLSGEELEEFGEQLDDAETEHFRREYLDQVRAFPEVRALFERIKADGTRIALASSAKEDVVRRFQEVANIGDLVDGSTSSGDVERSKPQPDVFLRALEALGGIEPSEAVVVGDTPYDAEAASRIGLAVIGLACSAFSEADLLGAGCVAVYRDPSDLLARYDESPMSGRDGTPVASIE